MPNATGPGAPFRWLADAFALCARGWPQVLGGSGFLVAVALAPSALQLLLQAVLPGLSSWTQMLTTILGLVLMPPALGGFLRLLQSLDHGRPASAAQVTSLYSDAPVAQRLILCNLLFAVVTVLAMVVLVYSIGGQPLLDYVRTLSAIKPGATPADLPVLPDGTLVLVGLLLLVALFVTTAQQLAAAQIALGGRTILRACGDGTRATVSNAFALLLFYLPIMLLGMLVTIALAIVGTILATALAAINGALASLAVVLFTLAVLVPLYALMLAFFYRAWIALFASDADRAPTDGRPTDGAPHEIAA
ncbi:hypothetical protein BH11PSE14_BH11PSE14_07140 [soil metagenome]